MKIYALTNSVPPLLNQILKSRNIVYSPRDSLQLSCQVLNYLGLSQSLGLSRTYVVMHNKMLIAEVSLIIRSIAEKKIGYIGDLWIHPDFRQHMLLFRLLKMMKEFSDFHSIKHFYCIVKENTLVKPSDYTGRVNIPLLSRVGFGYEIFLSTESIQKTHSCQLKKLDFSEGCQLFKHLTRQDVFQDWPNFRSKMIPLWLSINKDAVLLLEDSEKVMKTFSNNKDKVIIGHIIYFGFLSPEIGYNLLHDALCYARKRFNMQYLRLVLAPQQFDDLSPYLEGLSFSKKPIDLYSNYSLSENIPLIPY